MPFKNSTPDTFNFNIPSGAISTTGPAPAPVEVTPAPQQPVPTYNTIAPVNLNPYNFVPINVPVDPTLPSGPVTLNPSYLIVAGPTGPTGPIGPIAYVGSGAEFVFVQSSPSTTWVVVHNLQKFPSVVIIDSSNREVEGDVVYQSNNQLTITFSSAFSGKAVCN